MKKYEKYLEALKTYDNYISINQWAKKIVEMYLKKEGTIIKEIEEEILKKLKSKAFFFGTVQVDNQKNPKKARYITLGHIFNRNIPSQEQYTIEEIIKAFSKNSYHEATKRELQVINRFFKECTNDKDVKELRDNYKIRKKNLEKLYTSFSQPKKIEFGRFWEGNSCFRIKKDATIFPDIEARSNEVYSEIDEFKLYELSPCIAYEMAIRNNDVKEMFLKLEIVSNMMNENQYLFHRTLRKETYEDLQKNNNLPEEYQKLTHEEYLDIIYLKKLSYLNYTNKNPIKLVNNYIKLCSELDLIQLENLHNELENKLINEYLIYPTGYKRKIPHSALNNQEVIKSLSSEEFTELKEVEKNNQNTTIVTENYKIIPNPNYVKKSLNKCLESKIAYRHLYNENIEEITNSQKEQHPTISNKDSNEEFIFEKTTHEEFIQIQSLSSDNKQYTANNIIPNFKRQVNDQNQIIVPINFSLSITEIMEYISKVHEKINPKSQAELLGQEFYKTNDLSNLNTINDKGKSISLDMINCNNPQKKLSDMLYVYDMKQKGYFDKDIINEVDAYHGKSAYLRNYIHDYFDIAKDYIENERYKELITSKSAKKQQ